MLLHEQLVPHVHAAALTAARTGVPIMRPLSLTDPGDPRGWTIPDAYGFGPSLWVAPVLEDGAREREVPLSRGDWIETWSGRRVRGGGEVVVAAPLPRIPVWVRAGSIVVSDPAPEVAAGLGWGSRARAAEPGRAAAGEPSRPLVATLWGTPRCGRAGARLADGGRIGWRDGVWEPPAGRSVTVVERALSSPPCTSRRSPPSSSVSSGV